MKFLEELKAAEKILGAGQGLRVGEMSVLDYEAQIEVVSAVLRRIPQLIEMIEMLEAYASLGRDGTLLDNKYVQRQHMAVDLLSKLEEGASKDASEK